MQRSDLLAPALGLAAAVGAWLVFGETIGLIVGLGMFFGILIALTLARVLRPAAAPAKVRKVRTPAARVPMATAVSMVPAGRSAGRATRSPRPLMEPGHAVAVPRPPELRLTHDILTGMATGGKTTRGLCSNCNATIWLSARRPVKARCPNCGHTRVLER